MEIKTYCHECGNKLGVIGWVGNSNLNILVDACKCVKQEDEFNKVIVCTCGKGEYNEITAEFINFD